MVSGIVIGLVLVVVPFVFPKWSQNYNRTEPMSVEEAKLAGTLPLATLLACHVNVLSFNGADLTAKLAVPI